MGSWTELIFCFVIGTRVFSLLIVCANGFKNTFVDVVLKYTSTKRNTVLAASFIY